MLSKKRISPFELNQVLGANYVILTLKFDGKDTVKDTVEKLKDEIIGLNLRLEGNYLVRRKKEDIQVHQLPPSSNFDSIYSMTSWASTKYLPKFKHEMGTISCNDDTIILNLNHAICDGKYIAGIAQHAGDPLVKPNSYFPITVDEEFGAKVKKRLQKPPKFFRNDKNNTISHGLGMENTHTELLTDSVFDTKIFANYDPKKKICKI